MRAQRAVPVVAAALATLLMTGCGVVQAGTAAVVGDQVVSDSQVSAALGELIDQIGEQNVDLAAATPATVTRLTQQLVVDEAARREGVVVTASDVATLLKDTATQNGVDVAGVEDALAKQAWVPRSGVEAYARLFLEQQKLATKLGGGSSDQGSAALNKLVGEVSADLGVQLAPRYGVWDDATFAPGPAPTDLAAPAPTGSP